MIITHHGADFFKVSFGDTSIAVNPISKDSKIKSTKFGSDITLVSLNSPEHSGSEQTSRGDKESFIINGPGEYEVSGVFIKGFLSGSNYGAKDGDSKRINTIYTVTLEGMTLGFLGALGDKDLSSDAKEALDGIDILFVPIGGNGVLDPTSASKIALQFEPKMIIPSHFALVGESGSLKKFLKEVGEEDVKPVDKLTLKKKDLEGKEGDVIILEAI